MAFFLYILNVKYVKIISIVWKVVYMGKLRLKLIREVVIIAVYQYLLIGDNLDDVSNFISNHEEIKKNKEEINFTLDTFNKVVENEMILKEKIQQNLKEGWSSDRLSKLELSILYTSVYEILILNNNKEIVINEAVELTKKYCDDGSYKYINGVLNQF